jgi:predicted enzyme related to lactoylglutathione lyase
MRRTLFSLLIAIVALPALLMAGDPPKAAPAKTAQILGVGAIVIFSKAPDSLARWYAAKFGLALPLAGNGGYYGTLKSADGQIQLGIVKYPQGMAAHTGPGNFAITYRVNDFDTYVVFLAQRGLKPVATSKDKEGRYATYLDLDGNAISIWGK